MKKADIVFVCAVVAVFLPFVLSEPVYEAYKSFNAAHGMIVSFIKFAVLSTAGEMLGARITTGAETKKFLENLGFTAGEKVTVITETGGNLIVQVKEARVVISREMANKIMV